MAKPPTARHAVLLVTVLAATALWAADPELRAASYSRVDDAARLGSADNTVAGAMRDDVKPPGSRQNGAATAGTAGKSAPSKTATAQKTGSRPTPPMMTAQEMMRRRVTPKQRQAAGDARRRMTMAADAAGRVAMSTDLNSDASGALVPDYFGATPNSAWTQPLTKFVDTLPDLKGLLATADTTTYPGSDYYEIELVEYSKWQFHSELPATAKLRGYRQTNVAGPLPNPSYLGPLILATRGRPTRIKFTNNLPTTANGGNLVIPTDTSIMGAGAGYDPASGQSSVYPQNRGTLHLHGGFSPWVSDGTPHQWVTPTGEPGPLKTGVSTQNVPDMDLPPGNSMTFYWPNQQSGRLMFYHDHAYGITRLNVYAGEAAGYLLRDVVQDDALAALGVPGTIGSSSAATDLAHLIPLVIQDKTFVWGTAPAKCGGTTPGTGTFATDPTWCDPKFRSSWGQSAGSLWFPHIYMPSQNPWDETGANAMGRWDYAPWFYPPYAGLLDHDQIPNPYFNSTTAPWEPPSIPAAPNPSLVPEAFMDTPIVNGKAYPTLTVDAAKYRFRILAAANDRMFNLSLFVAADKRFPTTSGTTGAVLCRGEGTPANCTEVKMVPFNATQNGATPFPAAWYTASLPFPFDNRDGGVPDPTTRGPAMIQIGNEGGLLPAPVVIPNQPINYQRDRRSVVLDNIKEHGLLLGPAERADVIIDFSKFAGSTLILYNDAPAALPGGDPRFDYYTGDPDETSSGGAPPTLPGQGPNTRTIMQIVVRGAEGDTQVDAVDTALLNTLAGPTGLPAVFASTQDPIIVPQAAYKTAYPSISSSVDVAGSNMSRLSDTTLKFRPVGSSTDLTIRLMPKSINEQFELEYGRLNATLGIETPASNILDRANIGFGYVDPATEIMDASATIAAPALGDGTQIWKISHNGVDSHAIHFHLFNVQVINRVDWDGAIRLPDANELGWKETVRMNPLEDIIVAMRPTAPKLPFGLPDSFRLMDVTTAPGTSMQFSGTGPDGNAVTVTNTVVNFGWEYVWHCHLLGHEESDMMRPIVFNVARALPPAPANPTYAKNGSRIVTLTWTDATPFNYSTGLPASTLGNPANEVGFRIERAPVSGSGTVGTYTGVLNPDSSVATTRANRTSWTALAAEPTGSWSYRVVAFNAAGDGASAGVLSAPGPSSAVSVSPTVLHFAAIKADALSALTSVTPAQTVTVAFAGTQAPWVATANQTWLQVGNGSGAGAGLFTVSIVNPGNVIGGSAALSGTITVTASTAPNSPLSIPVTLSVLRSGASAVPFGSFDSPAAGATGLQGSFAVTGWALDDIAVDHVELWRDPAAGEPTPTFAGSGPGNGKIFIGNAFFVAGARPDVQALFQAYPFADRAGWGYLLMSWGLWGQTTATSTISYKLYAYAFDVNGQTALLGSKTISVDNAHATRPFGAIDTPSYGGTVSGGIWNYGWALTPQRTPPCTITNGNVLVGIDSGALAPVNYGDLRTDIVAAFPGFSNSANAGGAYHIDTTTLSNGTHQIGWLVTDSCGRADGVGSRFFTVLNAGADSATPGLPALSVVEGKARSTLMPEASRVDAGRGLSPVLRQSSGRPEPLSRGGDQAQTFVSVRHLGSEWQSVAPSSDGWHVIEIAQDGRIEVQMPSAGDAGYDGTHLVSGERRTLPLGSSLDAASGVFYWQPAPGFLGSFDLVFAPALDRRAGEGSSVRVRAVVGPPMRAVIDAPRSDEVVDQSFTVAGWALDLAADKDTGVDTVHVWAYPVDASEPTLREPQGRPEPRRRAIFLGIAAYGDRRDDVGKAFGDGFTGSAYSLAVDSLSSGTYDVVVYPHRARTNAFDGAQVVRIVVK